MEKEGQGPQVRCDCLTVHQLARPGPCRKLAWRME